MELSNHKISRKAILLLISIIITTAFTYSYQINLRGWYADDFSRVNMVPRNSFFEYLNKWRSIENGRLDSALQYFLHTFSNKPLTAHIITLIFHLVNIVLFFNIARKLFSEQSSLAGTIIFAIHQQGCSAVFWASNLCYLFSSSCMLLAVNIISMNFKKNYLKIIISSIVFTLGMSVHEQPLFAAVIAGTLFIPAGQHNKIKSYIPALAFCLSSIVAFTCQKLLSNIGKASSITMDNIFHKTILQMKQASFRAVSPGLRKTLIPLFQDINSVDTTYLFFFIVSSVLFLLVIFAVFLNYKHEQKEAECRFPFISIIKGILLFSAAYFIGCFAPHPYLVKRMFYIASFGFCLTTAGVCCFLLTKFENNTVVNLILSLCFIVFSTSSIAVILKNSNFYEEITRTEKTINHKLSIKTFSDENIKTYILGVKRVGAQYNNSLKGYPDSLSKNTRLLRYKNNTADWIGTVNLINAATGTSEKFNLDNGKASLNVIKYQVTDTPLAIIGENINLLSIDFKIVEKTEFHINFTLHTEDYLILHKVYPRILLIHKDNSVTRVGFIRAWYNKIDEDTYIRRIFNLIDNDSEITEIKIFFEPVASSQDLAIISKSSEKITADQKYLYIKTR
ncbi:MAG: hypothetical protein ACYTFY_00315 [Planctomycetota bacterium]|jgi:hypothetical protein